MKEEEIKKIVQKSILKTSDGFMEALMDKIEEKEAVEEPLIWPPGMLLAGVGSALLIISFLLYKLLGTPLSVSAVALSAYKTAIFVPIILLFLLVINHVVKLNENYQSLKKPSEAA